jgi:oligogalacturonide lyase
MIKQTSFLRAAAAVGLGFVLATSASAQIGKRFPSEKKVVKDPVTGVQLTFLTSKPAGDSKIYPTHPQWTADGKWLIFRSGRVPGQAMAVNEDTGDIVQVTENGYMGMLCVAQKSMKLYLLRPVTAPGEAPWTPGSPPPPAAATPTPSPSGTDTMPAPANRESGNAQRNRPRGPIQVIEVDLAKVFADSKAGRMAAASSYERVCGTIPASMAAGDLALDANEDVVYLRVGKDEAAKHLKPGTKIEDVFGPRNMGAGPTGLISLNLQSGEIKFIVAVPFQIGHVQSNPWVPGEIVFCWETGGKSPQRTWTVMADGTGLRPLYPEAPYEWVTHEAVITKDEVAFAILGHRKPGTNDAWGPASTREKPTGLAIANLRTREMRIVGQTPSGSGLWHVHGSPDGRWAVGDDFARDLYLIDRNNSEMMLLTAGHKTTASDHLHPTFKPDGTKIQIQSAMLSEDGKAMNICIVPVPKAWLKRTYPQRTPIFGNP